MTFRLRVVKQADWFNLDLTATKKFGKMEIGAIAYGSRDLNNYSWNATWYPFGSGKRQTQFAVGGLVGYDFACFIAQAKLATDIEASNVYPGKETRGTLTIIKPLWNPSEGAPK
jgi:hypothetical protein